MVDDVCAMSEHGACCCTCANHIKDCSHPHTDGESISKQRGWICAAPEFDSMFSGWSEHGLCEMYESTEDHQAFMNRINDLLKADNEKRKREMTENRIKVELIKSYL